MIVISFIKIFLTLVAVICTANVFSDTEIGKRYINIINKIYYVSFSIMFILILLTIWIF